MSTSSANANLRVRAWRTLALPSACSAMPTNTILSNLPGRMRAASIKSGRLVAPTTNTCGGADPPRVALLSATPSSSANSCATTRSVAPPPAPPAPPRAGARASSSSKNITAGAASLALANTSLTFRSLSPMYASKSSGPFTAKKLMPPSCAMALASMVFPVPGGPQRSTPRLLRNALPPVPLLPMKSMGACRGSSKVSLNEALAFSSPPMSLHSTLGTRTAAAPAPTRVRTCCTACSSHLTRSSSFQEPGPLVCSADAT
mmetsp:Transcript_3651/g.22861  ORF Transcript_3651/g.22861 Transcript_3651/m.22861 type:complete len:260 (-) Transcript_3651:1773-2552(-)